MIVKMSDPVLVDGEVTTLAALADAGRLIFREVEVTCRKQPADYGLIAEICRAVYPDVCGGMYAPDELRDAGETRPMVIDARPAAERTVQPMEPVQPRDAVVVPEPEMLSYLGPPEHAIAGDRAADLPGRMDVSVASSSGEQWYTATRLDGGIGWACTCRAGETTKRGKPSPCSHAKRAELKLAQWMMGEQWHTVRRQCSPDGHIGDPLDWDTFAREDLDEAISLWHAWRESAGASASV